MPARSDTALARARGLFDLIDGEADRSEADATLSPVAVQAFHDSGLFGLLVPKELGGEESDVTTGLAVFEEACRADGSAGWTLLANATTTAFAGAYCGPRAIAEIFAGDRMPVSAGQFSPRGTAVRTGEGAGDSFVVSGRYSFGSGCAHSDWIGSGALELRDGEFVLRASGTPVIRAYFVPRDRVELLGNWDVMGLTGTGSYDYEVPEQTVHEDFTFDLTEGEPQRGGPVYRLGVLGLTAVGHAAFALGVGRRGMEELTRIVQTKHRLGAAPLRDQQLFRHEYAMHDAALLARARSSTSRSPPRRTCSTPATTPRSCSVSASARRPPTRPESPPTRSGSRTRRPAPTRCATARCSGASATCTRRRSTSSSTTTPSPRPRGCSSAWNRDRPRQRMARGLTGEPVPRGITRGATTNWNAQRSAAAHAAASASKSALSRIGMPM